VEINFTITETEERILSLEAKNLILQTKYKKLKARVIDQNNQKAIQKLEMQI